MLKQGNLFEGTDDYDLFVKKFELKKTTDDCYTPPIVMDAINDWVAQEYSVDKQSFIRPFYPGGDYQSENYQSGQIVVDNPPFSILSEIIRFYRLNNIRFFLFAPHLTLFSSESCKATCLPVGASITYENGAVINTSFVTNLDNPDIIARTSVSLYEVIKSANEKNTRLTKNTPPHLYLS